MRPVAQEAARQADNPLAAKSLGTGGVGDRIDQAIIDRRETGRRRIAEITQLQRRWLAGENLETVVTEMTGQINQQIDAVCDDPPEDHSRLLTLNVGPMIDIALQAAGDLIRAIDVGIAADLEAIVVVCSQQRLEASRQCVLAKIRRNITNPQATLGIAADVFKTVRLPQLPTVALVPPEVSRKQFRRADVRSVIERQQQLAVRRGETRMQRQRLPERRCRLPRPAEAKESASELVIGLREFRGCCRHRFGAIDGFEFHCHFGIASSAIVPAVQGPKGCLNRTASDPTFQARQARVIRRSMAAMRD